MKNVKCELYPWFIENGEEYIHSGKESNELEQQKIYGMYDYIYPIDWCVGVGISAAV